MRPAGRFPRATRTVGGAAPVLHVGGPAIAAGCRFRRGIVSELGQCSGPPSRGWDQTFCNATDLPCQWAEETTDDDA